MKSKIKFIPLLLLILAAGNGYCQSAAGKTAAQHQAMSNGKSSDHFDVPQSGAAKEGNSVDYTLSHAGPGKLHILLTAKYEKKFMVAIRDSKGKSMMWTSGKRSSRYNEDIDVSSLAQGKYDIAFLSEGSEAILHYASIE